LTKQPKLSKNGLARSFSDGSTGHWIPLLRNCGIWRHGCQLTIRHRR